MVHAAAPAPAAAGGVAKVEGFFTTIVSLLANITVGVVTIAIIFIGYQVAFNNKRLSDMSGVIIGAVIVGAAGQIANLLAATATGTT